MKKIVLTTLIVVGLLITAYSLATGSSSSSRDPDTELTPTHIEFLA